jgi:hypothetical protein
MWYVILVLSLLIVQTKERMEKGKEERQHDRCDLPEEREIKSKGVRG